MGQCHAPPDPRPPPPPHTHCSATSDEGPLNRAEWVKFVSTFFNMEIEANRLFDSVAKSYNDTKAAATQGGRAQPRCRCCQAARLAAHPPARPLRQRAERGRGLPRAQPPLRCSHARTPSGRLRHARRGRAHLPRGSWGLMRQADGVVCVSAGSGTPKTVAWMASMSNSNGGYDGPANAMNYIFYFADYKNTLIQVCV